MTLSALAPAGWPALLLFAQTRSLNRNFHHRNRIMADLRVLCSAAAMRLPETAEAEASKFTRAKEKFRQLRQRKVPQDASKVSLTLLSLTTDLIHLGLKNAQSPFLRLPKEIRLQIYGYIFEDNLTAHFHVFDEVYDSCLYREPPERPKKPAIRTVLLLCRTIYQEAWPVLYDNVVFTLCLFAGSPRPENLNSSPRKHHKICSSLSDPTVDFHLAAASGAYYVVAG